MESIPKCGTALTEYDGEYRFPLVLAQGSPIFHSSCKRELEIALESLQGKIELIYESKCLFLACGPTFYYNREVGAGWGDSEWLNLYRE